MGDAPMPRLAPRGRPTLITDLPTDVLSYIISLVPGELPEFTPLYGRVRLSVVCRAFADAIRPPSAVWEDIDIDFAGKVNGEGLREQYNTPSQQGAYGTLERAMQVAGPCVRRFAFYLNSNENEDAYAAWDWVERVLAATPCVQRVDADSAVRVEAPPPMISARRAAIMDFWGEYITGTGSGMDHVLALHRRLVAVDRQAGSVAARSVPVLTTVGNLNLAVGITFPGGASVHEQRALLFIRSFAADVGQHLTRLHLPIAEDTSPTTAPACVDHLPALRELHVGWCDDDPLDLRSVVTPPRGLTCLVVDSTSEETVLLPPAIMARLQVMGLSCDDAREPPVCLRDAGNSFRRLTRLVYGGKTGGWPPDLGWWATPEFAVPTLVVLEVAAPSFTLGAVDGPAWAATVASTTLPRLERLALFQWKGTRHHLHTLHALPGWVYGPVFEGSGGMPADAVAEAITHSLPAAAAAAGRSLSVHVQGWNSHWDTVSGQVNPQIKEDPEIFLVTLKYEARQVR